MKNSLLAAIVGVMLVGCGGADTSRLALNEQSNDLAAVGGGNTVCDTGDVDANAWQGRIIQSNMSVPAGKTCRIYWSEVKGNVNVQGDLITIHTQFDKNVNVDGGSLTVMNWGSTFLGNLSIKNSPGRGGGPNGFWSDYSATVISGDFSYQGNSVPLYTEGNVTVNGNMTYDTSPCGNLPTVLGSMNVTGC
jgi:hypothetical protein